MKASGGKTMNNKFAQNFTTLRKEKGYTQASVAEKLSVSSQAVSKWENGDSMPDVSLLGDIADLFGVTIDELFGRENKEKVTVIDPPKGDYSGYLLRIDAGSPDGAHAKVNIPLSVAMIMLRGKAEVKIGDFTLTEKDFTNIIDMVDAGVLGPIVEAESPDGGHAKIYVEKR